MMEETTPLVPRKNARTHRHKSRRPPDDQIEGEAVCFRSFPGTDISDKADRRSWFGRIAAAVLTQVQRVGKMLQDNEDDNNDDEEQIRDDSSQEYFYEEEFNDHSWRCTFGTNEDDGIWLNFHDKAGLILAIMVWILTTYSGITIALLAQNHHLPPFLAKVYCTICAMSLACHAKTTLTDPGTVPLTAVPLEASFHNRSLHAMCSQCQSYKPPNAHHCRICNRCVSRMDHHCPWMNNCVGAANEKYFILFLCYTWTGCALALLIFAWNYFLCASDDCVFSDVLIQLVRVMTVLCIITLLFTSSMLMNVTYGIMTGTGTVDRLKKKASHEMLASDEEPMKLTDIFGIGGYWTWPLPIEPLFDDYDRVMGYSTTQRLLREQSVGQDSSISSKMYSNSDW